MSLAGKIVLFLVTEDWYFCSHRMPIARAARDMGAKVIVATRVNKHGDAITSEGFHVHPIAFDRSGLNPIKDFKTLRQIIKCYQQIKPDLVHHVAMKPALYGSLAAIWAKVPATVNAMAGLGFMFISNGRTAKLLRPFVKLAFRLLNNRKNSCIILQNADDADVFINEIRVGKNHVKVIRGSGIDINAYSVSPEPSLPIIASCVSRMLWDKGIGELVEAAKLLKARGVPLTIRLVGPTDNNPTSIPQRILDAWHSEGLVEVVGPSTDIARIYADSHIAVLPSYREGLPKSLLEAAACGRAMVATDVAGCREICREGETGLLVPARSAVALADALQKLTEDKTLRKKMATNARRTAEGDFAETIIARQTTNLYLEMLRR